MHDTCYVLSSVGPELLETKIQNQNFLERLGCKRVSTCTLKKIIFMDGFREEADRSALTSPTWAIFDNTVPYFLVYKSTPIFQAKSNNIFESLCIS